MKPRIILPFVLVVLLPLGAALFLGLRSMELSSMETRLQLSQRSSQELRLLEGRYKTAELSWKDQLGSWAQGTALTLDGLRGASVHPFVDQAMVLNTSGKIVFPSLNTQDPEEQAFLQRAAGLSSRPWIPEEGGTGFGQRGGWQRWYWEGGEQLFFWIPRDGNFLLFETRLPVLLDEFTAIASGPGIPADEDQWHFVSMSDSLGYERLSWGQWYPGTAPALASLTLDGPFQGWRLDYYLAPEAWPEESLAAQTALWLALVSLSATVLFLFVWLARGYSRRLREAGQRVSFVNQVSHELKTPLTNIRLYAEMAQMNLESLDNPSPQLADYIEVIDQESQRLSRMIHNVLRFGKSINGEEIRRRPVVAQDQIAQCIRSFEPSLEKRNLKLRLSLQCPETRDLDPDVLDQILGNLLSNGEKYAGGGQFLDLGARGHGETLELWVRDWGPGLPSKAAAKVQGGKFAPFERFHHQLTDGASGTGLGLYLVSSLAKAHGGALSYEAADPGAKFTVTLSAPISKENP